MLECKIRQYRVIFVKSRVRNSGPTTPISVKIELIRHINVICINIISIGEEMKVVECKQNEKKSLFLIQRQITHTGPIKPIIKLIRDLLATSIVTKFD